VVHSAWESASSASGTTTSKGPQHCWTPEASPELGLMVQGRSLGVSRAGVISRFREHLSYTDDGRARKNTGGDIFGCCKTEW
jgi:hypothetical protein